MAVTLKEDESAPAAWPTVTPYLRAAQLDPYEPDVSNAAVWQRIEAWISTRWPAREVVYTVEGTGYWKARLRPFTVAKVEVWVDVGWIEAAPHPDPFGDLNLTEDRPYRITGTAGDDSTPPDVVQEAWRRLHSYMVGNASATLDGLSRHSSDTHEATRGYGAKAMQLSGAADLLRPYRRLS